MRTFIVVVCCVVVLVTAGTIIVGTRSFEGIVVEKPYETGLAWDKAEQQRKTLGWTLVLDGGPYRVGTNQLVITILDRERRAVRDANVTIKVTRPSTTAMDRTYTGELQHDLRYHASVDLVQYGNWDLLVLVAQSGVQAEYILHLFAERTYL